LSRLKQQSAASVGGKQVRVKMLTAGVNPSDLGRISGWYRDSSATQSSQFPRVAGSEGVGEVLEAGKGSSLSVGQKVLFRGGVGTWAEEVVVDESHVRSVPKSLDANVDYAAALGLAPSTAYRLLHDFEALAEGDVIIQNAGNGSVGQAVMQMAAARGIKTISVVRARPDAANTVERLKGYGAYLVVEDSYIRRPEYRRLVADLPAPKLALDGVGGPCGTELARILAPNGTLVAYGGMSGKPLQIPTSVLVSKNISVRGFSLANWIAGHSAADQDEMIDTLARQVADKKLRLWLERHRFEDYKLVLERVREQRDRKPIFVME
jgi:mitochondrial enoyl-[acyl-carrier protein] reductase / trans-2-enoyl-CoA reductase